MMNDNLRSYLYLHFCVVLWGFTAILGKLISIQALPLVWWRVLLCSAALWLLIPRARMRGISRQSWMQMALVGALVGVHWLCFYGAVKLSNASVAVATMATTSFFSALSEPLLLRKPMRWFELGLGLLILPGMALVAGAIDWSMRAGFAIGTLGALLAAIFTALNKRIMEDPARPPAEVITFAELFAAFLTTSLVLPAAFWLGPELRLEPAGWDWLWLLILAGVCTLLPFYLSLLAMRHLSAFSANLVINLEPVYGVLLAALFFQEHKDLPPGFYIGVLIILGAVFSHPFLKKKLDRPSAKPI